MLGCLSPVQILYFFSDAHCVKVFNNAGVYLYDIGSEGSGDGQLSVPTGLVINQFNYLIVFDQGNKRLQLFTLDGKFVSKLECNQFYRLSSIALSSSGHLFVTEYLNECIFVFR